MKLIKPLLLATMLATHDLAFAHGDAHARKKPAAVKKEQKEWGIAGDAKAAQRTITFRMSDNMRFTPDEIEVKQGQTVRFVIENGGNFMHEFVLGTTEELKAHAAVMMKFPDMEHDEPYMVHVGPGKTGEVVWTFNRAGAFDFACLIAGHFDAGMKGRVHVVARKVAAASNKLTENQR